MNRLKKLNQPQVEQVVVQQTKANKTEDKKAKKTDKDTKPAKKAAVSK